MWFSGAAPKHRRYCRRSHVPAQTVYNPVTGGEREAARYQSCAVFRIGRSCEGNCGADGFYWQPKKDRDLFKYIKLVSR
jgi:hypothetical protein